MQQDQEERRAEDGHDDADREVAQQPRHEVGERPAGSAPAIAEIGTTRRAGAPDQQPDDVGTTSPTNPIRPVIATAAAVVIDGQDRRIPRSRLTSTPRWRAADVAEEHSVERARAEPTIATQP